MSHYIGFADRSKPREGYRYLESFNFEHKYEADGIWHFKVAPSLAVSHHKKAERVDITTANIIIDKFITGKNCTGLPSPKTHEINIFTDSR